MAVRRPAGEWTAEQAFECMVEIAAADAERWASSAFVEIEALASATPPEVPLMTEAREIAAYACIALVDQTDHIADEMQVTADQRRRFIVARVLAFQARLSELLCQPISAGRA